jgi:hypothetical protein
MRTPRLLFAAVPGLLACTALLASAATLDGRLDPDYGAPLSVQASQTLLPDATAGRIGPTNGAELDAAYAFIADNTLHVFIAGNLWCEGNAVDYGLHYSVLQLFLDTGTGGENPVSGFSGYHYVAPPGGLTFDTGFSPGWWFGCAGLLADPYDPSSTYKLRAFTSPLPSPSGGTVVDLGSAGAGGPGSLTGGTNPEGVQLAVDNSNVGGVTHGCDASSGAGVTTGIEWAIPLSAIGNPTGCLRVSALLTWGGSFVVNQVLAPVPPGTCTWSAGPGVDFAGIAGNQFVQVCPEGVPARTSTWGALKSAYR